MSGIGSTGGVSSNVPGTNVPPVSFPGIVSGIDYNSIIEKLTSLTLAPVTQLDQQIGTLNAANAELLKINGMLASLQNALTDLSQPDLFAAYDAVSSNSAFANAQGIPNVTATPGTYIIDSTTLATATQVFGNIAAGHTENDSIGGSVATSVPLVDSYAAITPTNGSGSNGTVTIDGVTVSYDVTSQSLSQILATINTQLHAAGDAGFNIQLEAGTDTVEITDNHPVSLGAQGDQGNLLQVLRLDQAQVQNTSSLATVVGTAGVGGINASISFNSTNGSGQTTDANFVTPVTAGTFTINGVQISVQSAQNLYDVINSINDSAAGVIASYNSATGQITLTNKNSGPQSIVLGSGSDSSNFLTAAGLTTAAGATQTLGTQASVTFQTPGGSPQTVYSNSNSVTDAIPGVQLNLTAADASTPFTVNVSQDSTALVSAINTFVSAYNAVISEINTASAPPVVVQSATAAPGSAQSVGGGVLYQNADVQSIKDQLVAFASALNSGTGSSAYNSLASIGLQLTDGFQQLAATGTTGSDSGNPISLQQEQGTDGQLQPLNVQTLQQALAANPTAVSNLFNNSQGLVTQIGTYLTTVTGVSTITSNSLLGTAPAVSLIQGFENTIQSQVQNLQTQVTQIQDNANQQADALRAEFVASESAIAGYQALQQQLGSFFTTPGH
jgi:flagellar hook-associated protein 2